jgi:hypothetical protein
VNSADQWSRLRRPLRTGGTFPGSAAAVVRPLYMGPGDRTGAWAPSSYGRPGHRRTDGLGREGQERCARPRRFSASADRDDGVQDGIDHGGRDVQLIPACFPLRVICSCASFSPSRTSVETWVQAARSIDKRTTLFLSACAMHLQHHLH